ncbi:hypothetical protein ACFWF7_11055 [Nocardia sp. NPDC060256]|uniref:hypothetical protein n=1 Tax=unclassified Nocardia TaxID=2637762 RepID=UPI00365DBAE9
MKNNRNHSKKCLALTSVTVGILGAIPFAGIAAAHPPPPGCAVDYSVPNVLTLSCQPGAGQNLHAFLRCRDVVGILHSHIGITLGANGGTSRAYCGPGETGPQ